MLMKKLVDLTEFMEETYQGEQLIALSWGDGLKTNFIVWKSVTCPTSLNTLNMRYYRWLWFELNVPKKEANSRYLQLNSTSDFQP